jgi:xanthine dehydrogenase accessory factor
MNSLDWDVLTKARDWLIDGHKVYLFTVIQTWGSSPRVPGSTMAMRNDGHLVGSVSGGCIEDDLVDKVKNDMLPDGLCTLIYGISQDESITFGIPCGGKLQIVGELLTSPELLDPIIESIEQGKLIQRSVHTETLETKLSLSAPGNIPKLEHGWFHTFYGPQWRLLIIGANQLGAALANIALSLEFKVLICDPREEMRAEWKVPGTEWVPGMPDDVVLKVNPDAHTSIVAVTHDPKLDDMALLEALKCDAFYVGALGSTRNQAKRRDRMRMFDLTESDISKLHGPVGIPIGSRTPTEIAVSILAEIIKVRSEQRTFWNQKSTTEPLEMIA